MNNWLLGWLRGCRLSEESFGSRSPATGSRARQKLLGPRTGSSRSSPHAEHCSSRKCSGSCATGCTACSAAILVIPNSPHCRNSHNDIYMQVLGNQGSELWTGRKSSRPAKTSSEPSGVSTFFPPMLGHSSFFSFFYTACDLMRKKRERLLLLRQKL